MRVIAGEFRGRRIRVPRGGGMRPTTGRVREASFNLLSTRLDLSGVSVLDLYAGTGALGLEAVSRGGRHATFIESNPHVLRFCRDNVESLGVANRSTIFQMDASVFLSRAATDSFELILADPPYRMDGLDALVSSALRVLAPHGFLVIEHDRGHDLSAGELPVVSRRYGRTIVSLFSKEAFDE